MAGVGFTLRRHASRRRPPPPPLVKDTRRRRHPRRRTTSARRRPARSDNDGCPDKDTDGDGVVDRKDKCPDKAGPVERDGCPEEDKDNDGIADDKDKCPDEPEDKDQFEDEDGCPDPDNDKDGVLDAKDKCPTEAETKNGYQDDDGCPDEVPGGGQEVHRRRQGDQLPAQLGRHQGVVVPAAQGGGERVQGVSRRCGSRSRATPRTRASATST